MAHTQQIDFLNRLRSAFPAMFSGVRVLEIGSQDINGAIRSFFSGGSFLGLDVAEGPGVDVVCQGQDFDAPDASFDTVISCEVMEHNPAWKETMANMARLCRPGGMVIMTCASIGRKEHGTARTTPQDSPLTVTLGWTYYRNLRAADIKQALPLKTLFSRHAFFYNIESRDLYFFAFRSGGPAPANFQATASAFWRYYLRVNIRALGSLAKQALLMRLVGKERYWAGPVRLGRGKSDVGPGGTGG